MLVQIGFKPASPQLRPPITHTHPALCLTSPACIQSSPATPGWLIGEERVKETLSASLSLSLCMPGYVCVEVKYSLCCVREAVCQKGRGGEVGSRWTASSLALVLCPHLLLFPAHPLYLFIHLSFHTCPCHFFLPSHLPLFPSLFLAPTRWQHGAELRESRGRSRGKE